MQPDHETAAANFAVDGLTVSSAMDTARGETENIHEKVVLGGNVLADEKRDEFFDLRNVQFLPSGIQSPRQPFEDVSPEGAGSEGLGVGFAFSIAATRSLAPEPQRDTVLSACVNGTSSGWTRLASIT